MIPDEEMTCRELVELVTAYLDDGLTASERTRFEAHLQECPYCRVYLEQMRQTILLLGELREDELDPVARDELLRLFRDWKSRNQRLPT